jgi:hypothetical protein
MKLLRLLRGVLHAIVWTLNIEGAWSYLQTRIREMKKFLTVTEERKK